MLMKKVSALIDFFELEIASFAHSTEIVLLNKNTALLQKDVVTTCCSQN